MRMSRAALRSREVGMLKEYDILCVRSNIYSQMLQLRVTGESNEGEVGKGVIVKTRESSSCWSD